ncbi:MAG TPA: hypothetical protein VN461_14045 [Vicinamibacteria bacterium]|jgi:hypothetical protein|nr:hypothetical protein [Vicinamibacteria bacterium]
MPVRTLSPEGGKAYEQILNPWGPAFTLNCPSGLTLAADPHVVRFRHPAYEPVERTVSVRPGQTEPVVVDLPSESTRKP